MTVAVSTLLGRPLWFELMTTDMKAAEPFYRTVVGWGVGSVRRLPSALHLVQKERRAVGCRPHDEAGRGEGAAILVHVCWRAETRGGRGPYQEARRQRVFSSCDRGADHRPHADDDRPSGRCLLHLRAGAHRSAAGRAGGTRRGGPDRADDDRCSRRR